MRRLEVGQVVGGYRVIELAERELPDGRIAYMAVGMPGDLGPARICRVALSDQVPAGQGQRRAAARELAHTLLATKLQTAAETDEGGSHA